MDNDNFQKYLKYKKKYMELKNTTNSQYGGNQCMSNFNYNGGTNGSAFQMEDEIHFWGKQMMEHALFLHLGLEDDNQVLKKEALDLSNTWKKYLETYFYNKGIVVTPESIFLTADDLKRVGKLNTNVVTELIDTTEKFKRKVIEVLRTGKWIGWIFISLAKHMLKETLYFKRKVNGPVFSPEEEIKFANNHHCEELGTTAQQINPDDEQQKIIDVIRSYAMKKMDVLKQGGSLSGKEAAMMPFPSVWTAQDIKILEGMDIGEKLSMLAISIRFGEEITSLGKDTVLKIKSGELRSIISPILAYHVYREFARLTETLKLMV